MNRLFHFLIGSILFSALVLFFLFYAFPKWFPVVDSEQATSNHSTLSTTQEPWWRTVQMMIHPEQCEEKMPNVEVFFDLQPLNIVHSLGFREINRIDINVGDTTSRPGFTMGIYKGSSAIRTQSKAHSWETNGKICARINTMHVTFTLTPTIFIPKEISDTSCIYNEIYRHELQHYQNELATIQHLHGWMLQTARFYATPLIDADDASRYQALLNERQQQVGETIQREFSKQAELLHLKLDTPQEYNAFSRSCSGATLQFVQSISRNQPLFP